MVPRKKFKLNFFKQLSKLSLCSRSKSNTRTSLNADSSIPTQTHLETPGTGYGATADSVYQIEQEYIYSSQYTTVPLDMDLMMLFESYVSSANESALSDNAIRFYNGNYGESSSAGSAKLLTIMNPTEFEENHYRGNIDDYDSDIESLHPDYEPVLLYGNKSVLEELVSTFENGPLEWRASIRAEHNALAKQLERELLRFEESI